MQRIVMVLSETKAQATFLSSLFSACFIVFINSKSRL